MLRFRPKVPADAPWVLLQIGETGAGLCEDQECLLAAGADVVEVFVDDEPLARDAAGHFHWAAGFYAGRVGVESRTVGGAARHYALDVAPNPLKSGQGSFDEMVARIRTFDSSLLVGHSPAAMGFGDSGHRARNERDVLLQRVRAFGPAFLEAVGVLARSPHRSLVARWQALPLSRLRRLHPAALRHPRLVAAHRAGGPPSDDFETLRVPGVLPDLSFDTPANRAMLALLHRFLATLGQLADAVADLKLAGPAEDQRKRAPVRLQALGRLRQGALQAMAGPAFSILTRRETSSAGLTQIAAQPAYGRAYRFGCKALSSLIDGPEADTPLHVPPSWGIYETWCWLETVEAVARLTGSSPTMRPSRAAVADRTAAFQMTDGTSLEVLLQAVFHAERPVGSRIAWSLSRERRPDIMLLHHTPAGVRGFVLDAKWRSGRANVLDAMASAHIYHDALRVAGNAPEACVLLLPGEPEVQSLESPGSIREHGVGALSGIRVDGPGTTRLTELVGRWMAGRCEA